MAVGDIYRIFVKFGSDPTKGKERYTVQIGRASLTILLFDGITSQYDQKSEYIKLQYYPIRDWREAGLKKMSYIDILSTVEVEFQQVWQLGVHTGSLTTRDIEELAAFIHSYKKRLSDFIK